MEDRDIGYGYRRLSSMNIRDLPYHEFERQAKICYYLYQTNAMASRIIEIISDFVIGDGISWSVKCKKLDDILWDFWSDVDNDFELFQFDLVQELFLYGEFVLPVKVLETTGKVKIGYIDPANIVEVIQDPNNPRKIDAIKVRVLNEYGSEVEKELKIIQRDRNVLSPTYGKLIGDTFLFQINKVSNATRGISEIYRLADWVKALDDSLFSSIERIYHIMNYIWDITVREVYDEKELEEIRNRIMTQPFTPSSVHIHSDRETYEVKAPDLKTEQITNYVELLRNFVLGGAGIPTSWYGEGDITRATAMEQGVPVLRRLRRKQKFVKRVFEKIFEFVKEKAIEYGNLVKGRDYFNDDEIIIEVIMSEIASKDQIQLMNTMKSIVEIVGTAQGQGWISPEKARELFYQFAKRILDIEIEPETKEEIEEKIEESEYDEVVNFYKKRL